MLAAFGTRVDEDNIAQTARAYAGAIALIEAMHELRNIRKALTTSGRNG